MNLTRQMLLEPWGRFDNSNQLTTALIQNGRFVVNIDNGQFECLLSERKSSRLFVLLSGARDPERQPLPKFDRWSWANMFPGSVLVISDPTLYLPPENLRIGWYIGTTKNNWLKSMATIVRAVSVATGADVAKTVTYGSSAGGFAALMLSAELEATAVAINPQIDVRNYSQRFVNDFLTVAFEGRSVNQLTQEETMRFSSIAAFKASAIAKCLLVQNLQDVTHYKRHYSTFCREFNIPIEGGG